MKPVWLWLAFLFLYGVFSIKPQAATLQVKKSGGAMTGMHRQPQ